MLPERLDPSVRKLLLKEDKIYIGQPFELAGDTARPIHAHTRHMALMLLDSAVESRASRAAEYLERLIDVTSAKHAVDQVACKKGCSLCCKIYVTTTLPEVFRLAQAIRGNFDVVARVNATAARYRSSTVGDVNCPILEKDACSAYLYRPGICRVVTSTSLERCREVFLDGSHDTFSTPKNMGEVRSYAFVMLRAALALAGLPNNNFELVPALAVALAHKDAEERWLGGEPLFASAAIGRLDRIRSRIDEHIACLVGAVRPTI
jgi:Fe-S-cluster containining protein